MSGSFAKDGRSTLSLPRKAASRQMKPTHARTGADCGKDVSQNRAICEDGISMERGFSAAVVKLVLRTERATSCSASTLRCRRGVRSKLSWRCGPWATKAFIICQVAGAIDASNGLIGGFAQRKMLWRRDFARH